MKERTIVNIMNFYQNSQNRQKLSNYQQFLTVLIQEEECDIHQKVQEERRIIRFNKRGELEEEREQINIFRIKFHNRLVVNYILFPIKRDREVNNAD